MNAPPPIAIPAGVRAAVESHALADAPAECCGYLVGPAGGQHVDEVVRCRNAQADGAHPLAPTRGADTGFVIAGRELIAFARSLDTARPARIVYHSHTHGRAYLSALDRALADGDAAGPAYPVQQLVIGVVDGAITETAQFAWDAAAGTHVEIARWSPRRTP